MTIAPSLSYLKKQCGSTATKTFDISSQAASTALCLLIGFSFGICCPEVVHWFVVPVSLCGVLIGSDAVKWVRNRLDFFDPVGIIAILGFHFFFLAPLLHVATDYWMGFVAAPPDWRDWVGKMAMLNFVGLLIYRFSRKLFRYRRFGNTDGDKVWLLDKTRFQILISLSLLLTATLQYVVYVSYGGLVGYIAAYEAREGAFAGMGWVFMISESFPILALMAYSVHVRDKREKPSWFILALVMLVFLVLKLAFGGLRGSRSNTVWGLFWAIGIIHFWIRPLSRKFLVPGVVFLLLFMYIYGFYKGIGREALQLIHSPEIRYEMEAQTGRTFEAALLGDLARSDVQAYLLYRLWNYPSDYDFGVGRTYLGALVLLIPKSVWADRPVTKVKEGTEALYGKGSFPSLISSRIYGLSGEGMLNFGPVAVPMCFVILGFVVARVRVFMLRLNPQDCRWLLVPFLINLSFIVLVGDSDNLVFFIIKNCTVPALVLLFGSKRYIRGKKASVAAGEG